MISTNVEKKLCVSSFLRQIVALYSASFKTKDEIDIYKSAVIDLTKDISLDFKKLYKLIVAEHNSNFAPAPAKIKDFAQQCKTQKGQEQKYRHPKIYNPIYKKIISTDCFPTGTTDEQIIKTYENMFNCTGWKIIEG